MSVSRPVSSSVLLCALLCGLTGRAEPAWPKLEILDEVEIPGEVVAQSRPVHLHAQRARGLIVDVAALFRTAFLDAGYYVLPSVQLVSFAANSASVTGLDVVNQKSYTVILQPADAQSVTVIYGQVNLSPEARVAPPEDGLPLYPGAPVPLRVATEGGAVSLYEVKAAKADLRAFYARKLPLQGYKALHPEDENTLIFEGHGEALRISLLDTPAKKVRVVVTSHLTPATGGL